MNNETNMREALSNVRVEGLLAEKNLEVKKDKDGKDVITGDLKIQTGETNVITFRVYTPSLKKDGTSNKIYESMQTVMNEYKSIADVGRENADVVRVTAGQLTPNTFYGSNGQEVYGFQYRSSFFNRVNNPNVDDFKAEAELEIFIRSITEENDKDGNATGRLIIKGVMPLVPSEKNNVIEPITLYACAEDGVADAIEQNSDIIKPGNTVIFNVNIINDIKRVKIEKPNLIGKPKIEYRDVKLEELRITGVESYLDPEEDETGKAYTYDIINKAMTEREARLAEKKNAATNPATNRGGNNTVGSAPRSGRSLPKGW